MWGGAKHSLPHTGSLARQALSPAPSSLRSSCGNRPAIHLGFPEAVCTGELSFQDRCEVPGRGMFTEKGSRTKLVYSYLSDSLPA